MEKEGYVEKIIYQNEENGYTVASVSVGAEEEVFVGYLYGVDQGMYIVAEGEEVEHSKYDQQFKVSTFSLELPGDIESMRAYLGSGVIKGVGEALATRIIKKFKLDTFRIIEEEPIRLAEIKGISERKASEIAVQFMEKQEMRDAIIFLGKYGLRPSMAVKVYNEYGMRMYEILKVNPYRLAEDISQIGFKTADAIAMRAGIGKDSDFRIRAALLYALSQAIGLGHMYLPKEMLINKTRELLSYEDRSTYEEGFSDYEMMHMAPVVTSDAIEAQLLDLIVERKVIAKKMDDIEAIYSGANYYTELKAAKSLVDLSLRFSVDEERVRARVRQMEAERDIDLDEQQEQAVLTAAQNGVTIITGGPGTGKTTTINSIIHYFESEKMEIFLAAPTGRAAKRICEATGYEAQTIHRLLELTGGGSIEDGGTVHFERNASNPLETDVIIVDEMSMVDTFLLHALLDAVAPGTHLILVGDVDQLPSVGAGDCLRDIIQSNAFPVVFLTKIYRQAGDSDIVVNAHKINKGEQFTIDNKSKDFFFMKRTSSQAVIDELCVLVKENLPKYLRVPATEIQVLTPMKKGDLGVEKLNPILQNLLNPPSPTKMEREAHGTLFREGDKVMQIKNNYKLEWTIYGPRGNFVVDHGVGVFNGDVGTIASINNYAEEVTVLFDDNKTVTYPYGMLDELMLSYAITVHKSQGSEYPAVVMPLLNGPQVLMNRNLLYTGVTRAKNLVVLVGSPATLGNMIQNASTSKRYTSLDLRIIEIVEEAEGQLIEEGIFVVKRE